MIFQYTIDESAEEPIMLINKHIGMDAEDGEGIMGAQFQAELLALDTMGKKRIQVWINSPGGGVMDGMNIRSAILKSNTKVDTYCVGIAASEAANIFQTGRKRIMADYAYMMIHNPYHPTLDQSENAALKAFRDSIATTLCSRSGKTPEEVEAMMNKETWMSSAECFGHGFCDEIEVSNQLNKPRATPQVSVKSAWSEYNNVLNKIVNQVKQNTMATMSKVTAKLNLTPDANEDSILKGIEQIENRAADAETKLATAKQELEAEKAKLVETQNKVTELESKVTEAENKEKEATEAAAKVAATTEVTNHAKVGRIKNDKDTIDAWVNKYIVDPEGIKAMLEAIPMNKTAPSIVDKIEVAPATAGVAGIMMEIANKNKQL
ncbi:MAG: hypothetical protein EOP56_09405 [Sphingobacteriales bacterium]|nr:MAG: hypothetical protein EOP56_09405 [Sphingobacteriales bacterium]